MLSAGAEANTLAEMETTLRMSTDAPARHQSQNALSQQLHARNHDATEQTNAQILRSSNDFWMLPDLRPTDPFMDTLAEYYGAGVHLASFDTAPDESRQAINGKVSDDTAGLIPELLPKHSVDPSTVFVLTNALYFKARWDSEFPKDATAPAPFTTSDGGTLDVDMMRQTDHFDYFEGDGFRAASLPYFGEELDLVVLLPDAGTFADFIAGLDATTVQAALDGLASTKLELWMPKLEIHAEVALKNELKQAGMVDAFVAGVADFTPIADGLFVSDAFHQAALVIDEEGTEAAAATAFVGSFLSAPPPEAPVPFHLDAPFVFLLRDRATNAALFVGHYVSP
jgi:serpin B